MTPAAPAFARYIGIDYSGAGTPQTGLTGLRVYRAGFAALPEEIHPDSGGSKYWNRAALAEWLADRLAEPVPTLVGIDHGFSFPEIYFETHGLPANWPSFIEDFCAHWPTNRAGLRVDQVRYGSAGAGVERAGNPRWRRLAEQRIGAKSVFHFDVPGSVAKSTHAGLPWIQHVRRRAGTRLHCWPFDGWTIPAGRSAIAEIYPAIWSADYAREDRTGDQHDAYVVAAALQTADRNGTLTALLQPELDAETARIANIEGWILGVT